MAQVVPQIKDALVVDADSAPVDVFPYFLGMIPLAKNPYGQYLLRVAEKG